MEPTNIQYNNNITYVILKRQFKSLPDKKEYNTTANYISKVRNILENKANF